MNEWLIPRESWVFIYDDGTREWKNKRGKTHRMKGPAVICPDDIKMWYLNDQFHREDGPAIDDPKNGIKQWFLNGYRHREDGPAIEGVNVCREWWLNGVNYSESEWKKRLGK